MIEKTVYVSDDGKTFDDRKKCLNYEKQNDTYKKIAILWHNNVIMYDYKGTKIIETYNPETAPQKFITFIKDCIDSDVIFLHINHNLTSTEWNTIYNYFTYKTERGVPYDCDEQLYRYDPDDESWYGYQSEIKQLKDNWGSFCTID